MNYDYTMSKDQSAILASLIGKRLISTLSILDSGDSAGEYVLEFEDVEIVINAKEKDVAIPWLADTRVVEVFKRPVGSSDGNLLYPKRVGENIIGISRIITKMSHDSQDGSKTEAALYDRGLILHFATRDLVIDRGEESWSDIWRSTWANKGTTKFSASTPDPEYPEFSMLSIIQCIDQ